MGRKPVNDKERIAKTTQTIQQNQFPKRGRPRKGEEREGRKIEPRKRPRHNITYLWSLNQIKYLNPGRVILDESFARIMEEKRENPKIRLGLPIFIKQRTNTNEYVFKQEVLNYNKEGILYVKIIVDIEYKIITLNVVDRFNATYPAYWNRGWGENDIIKEVDLIINEILNNMVHFHIIDLPKNR